MNHEDDWFVVATILGRDIGMKGSVWRYDPLVLTLDNGKLNSSLNIFYRTKIGFTQREGATQSCGYNEPANAAMLGVGGKIAFSQDWYVDFTFKPTLQADIHCGEIFERIDLAKWSAPVIDRAMEAATEKVRTLVRAQTKIREQMIPIWAKLQEPIALAPGAWLEIRPYGAFANVPQVTDNGQYLTIKAGLEARPQVVAGARPRAGANPLPPLTGTEQGPGFNVDLRAIVEYAKMTRVIRQKLVGQTFARRGQLARAPPARHGQGRAGAARRPSRADFRPGHGVLPRHAASRGHVGLRNRGNLCGEVAIRDLDYTLETLNLLARLGDRLVQNRIRSSLQTNAQWDVSSELAAAYAQANQALNSEVTPQARLVSTLSQFGPGRIWVTGRGVEAGYRIAGQVTVAVNPF